jgi:formate dehydrogenase subunit delta
MSATTLDKLVYMANQIGREFSGQRPTDAVEATYDHLWHFWEKRMREAIIAHLDAGGEGMTEVARNAVRMLVDREGDPQPVTRATEFSGDQGRMSDAG